LFGDGRSLGVAVCFWPCVVVVVLGVYFVVLIVLVPWARFRLRGDRQSNGLT
jgi:hypothetical protein